MAYYDKPSYTYVLTDSSVTSKNRDGIVIEDVNVTIKRGPYGKI